MTLGRNVRLIPVPLEAQARLQELVVAHAKAKRDMVDFVSAMGVVLGLPPGASWNVDTDQMVVVLEVDNRPPEHQRALTN